jgi:hypothetical protein
MARVLSCVEVGTVVHLVAFAMYLNDLAAEGVADR